MYRYNIGHTIGALLCVAVLIIDNFTPNARNFMQILFDYIPIIALFIAFMLHRGQADALIIATKVMMIATVVQVCGYWLIKRRLEKIHIITFALVMILGGATVFLRDEEFIKMKPTALYWLFSVIMIVGQWRKKHATTHVKK